MMPLHLRLNIFQSCYLLMRLFAPRYTSISATSASPSSSFTGSYDLPIPASASPTPGSAGAPLVYHWVSLENQPNFPPLLMLQHYPPCKTLQLQPPVFQGQLSRHTADFPYSHHCAQCTDQDFLYWFQSTVHAHVIQRCPYFEQHRFWFLQC